LSLHQRLRRLGPDWAGLVAGTGNGFEVAARDRHRLGMLPDPRPQFAPCHHLIHNHHVQKLPRIDELRSMRTEEPQHGHGRKQRHFGIDDIRLLLPSRQVGHTHFGTFEFANSNP
jgi:hypothetical protein